MRNCPTYQGQANAYHQSERAFRFHSTSFNHQRQRVHVICVECADSFTSFGWLSPPWIFVHAKERHCLITIGAFDYGGHVLGCYVISMITALCCDDQFGREIPHSFTQQTPPNLTNSDSFIEYLEHIIWLYTKDQHAVRTADTYKAHKTTKVKVWCGNHSIESIIVLDRATVTVQPLNINVFGMEKLGMYHDIARRLFLIGRDEKILWKSTAGCVKAISRISVATGVHGWKDM